MFVTLIIKNISMRVYLTNFLIKSSFFVCLLLFFFSRLFRLQVNFITVIIVIITNSSIITIINVFVIKHLTLSLLLPLLLVLLFFLLLLISLYLLVFFSFSQCCYSYQVNMAITVSFVNFLIYTFAFHLWVSTSQVSF